MRSFPIRRSASAKPGLRRRNVTIGVLAVSLMILLTDSPAYADTASQVAKLLETGWKTAPDTFALAQEQYEQAKQSNPSDVRIPFAMALVAIKTQHNEQAAKYLKDALINEKPLLPIRRATIWHALNRNDVDSALAAIRDLGRIMSADGAPEDRPDYQESARWLGSVVGFGVEPGGNRFRADELNALDAQLSGDLKGKLLTEYVAGKAAVTKRFNELQEQLTATRQAVIEKNVTQLADSQTENSTALANIVSEHQTAAQLAQQLQDKMIAEGPVLKARGLELSRQWDQIGVHLKVLQDQLKREQSKQYKDQNQILIQNLNFDIKLEEQRVRELKQPIEKEMTELRSRLRANQSKLLAAQQDEQRLAKLEQSRTVKSKQLAKQSASSSSGNSPKSAAIASQLTSISTYVYFNLDQEKKRILATYGQNTVKTEIDSKHAEP